MKMTRRRFKQTTNLRQRLSAFKEDVVQQASNLEGAERENAMRRVRSAEFAVKIDIWISAPGLPPPAEWGMESFSSRS
ncbi:hypothetical protein [Bradyrhizobium acaciae]|uniref:hypothetical protein n=1 Tax=Bradyrhizobium acaciae TaxID=2683706 RepID=UPI001E5DD538|nr:hypothetical protein [Bradyrhizobium acaciae]MCC8982957.1 hypothetical protein [Bradyrhizobium acaciae]